MYPLEKRLGGPQSRSARYGKEKSLPPAGSLSPAVQLAACRYTDFLGKGGGETVPLLIRIQQFSAVNTETHHWKFQILFKFVIQSTFNRGKLF
jgi:hypothetical protein